MRGNHKATRTHHKATRMNSLKNLVKMNTEHEQAIIEKKPSAGKRSGSRPKQSRYLESRYLIIHELAQMGKTVVDDAPNTVLRKMEAYSNLY